MNQGLIDRWNRVVTPKDTVWHLGDFAMYITDDEIINILRQLNGHKNIVLGNHDERTIARHSSKFRGPGLFDQIVPGIHEIKYNKQLIVLCHYPMEVWRNSHKGSFHLHGHSHGTLAEPLHKRMFDVGVDPNGYFPVSFEEVVERMSHKRWQPIDHHQER